jgi:A118 family predicted phage portal protein
MRIWENIKKRWRGLVQRTAGAAGVAREFKDIFELGGVPAFNQFYAFGIFVWKALYRGLYRPWHVIPAPTVKDARARRELYRLNTAKAVCAELASLVWGEECAVNVSMAGRESTDENPDPLNEFVQDVLRGNAFGEKMQELIEQALALGGAAVKVWREVRRDREGNELPGSERIRLGYCMADQFVPTAWDNARVTEGVFISRRAKAGYYYTRLEWHKWDGLTYVVTNELYRADMQKGAAGEDSQDILGIRWPLAEIYPFLDEVTTIPVEDSLFSYFRTPIANNLDDNSPLGVSLYGNALETLHALDICYDSFVREFRLGKKRIIVPARAVRTVVDPETGALRRYFDATDETYEALASDNPDDLKITDNSVTLRVEEHVAALNAFLSILCLQVGFSASTFSFDERGGLKTATEVISENSKTYKTIKTVQNQLRPALEHMIRNIIDVAILYGMQWQGQSVESLAAGGYEVSVVFDDGVTQDRQTNINEGVMLVGAGLLSKKTFMTDPKYGQGLTPEQADAELAQIRAEGTGNAVDVTKLFGGME